MKVFAVILALAVISGCYGRTLPLDDQFEHYFKDLSSKAEAMMMDTKTSQLGKELETLVQDIMAELAMYKNDMETKVVPFAQTKAEQLSQDLQALTQKLLKHMTEAGEQFVKYGEEMQTVMEQNVDDVMGRVSAYCRKLKKRLNKDTQEINKKLIEYFENVQALANDNMEAVKAHIEPYVDQIRDNAEEKFGKFNEAIKDGTQDAVDNLKDAAENLGKILAEKWEEARNWFQSLTA